MVVVFAVVAVIWFFLACFGWMAYTYTRDNEEAFWASIFTIAFILFCINVAARI